MTRNENLHTSAPVARLNLLRFLAQHTAGQRDYARKAAMGYATFPDYDFRAAQGAAFAVAKITRTLEDEGLVRFASSIHGHGYHITRAGEEHLRLIEAS